MRSPIVKRFSTHHTRSGREKVSQRPGFATVELRMLSEPGMHRLFRPEEIVHPSTATEQIPNRLRCQLDELPSIHDDSDRLVGPAARIVQDSPLGPIEGGLS
jgi:hypothetical protein